MIRNKLAQQIVDLSFPVLAAGVILSAFGGAIEDYGLGRVVTASLMLAGSIVYLAVLLTDGIDRVSLTLWCGGLLLVGTISVVLTLFSPHEGVDLEVLLKSILQLTLLVGWIGYCSKCRWNSPKFWNLLSFIVLVALSINLAIWASGGFNTPFFGLANGKNSLATMAMIGFFASMGLPHVSSTYGSFLLAAICLGLASMTLLASVGRSVVIAIAIAFLTLTVIRGTKSRVFHGIAFALLLFSFVIGPVSYTSFTGSSTAKKIDRYSTDWIGLPLLSGRETLWPMLIQKVKNRPFVGHGSKAPTRFVRKHRRFENRADARLELSAHNLYLITAYQTGFVGLFVLFVFLTAIWRLLIQSIHIPIGRLALAFFIAILFRENFEISLTQNNLQMGLGEWAIIASGLSLSTQVASSGNSDRDENETESDSNHHHQ